MKRNRIIAGIVCVLAVAVCAAGSNWTEQIQLFKHGAQEEQQIPEEQQESSTVLEQELQNALTAAEQEAAEDSESAESAKGETKEVVLYFASADGSTLEAENREIPKEDGIARATMDQLIGGPREEDLAATIPSDTELLDINIADGLCTVDMSEHLMNGLNGSEDQLMALYSIVNTLTQFDTVDRVQVLVEGQQLGEISGVDASQAIDPVSFR